MRNKKMVIVVLCLALAGVAIAEYVPFKVKLNMMERMVISSFLPKEASFVNWKIFNDLRNELAPTEAEAKILDMKQNAEGGILANWSAVPEKEVTFGEVTEKIIIDTLRKLDSESKLSQEHISIYKKFILREK